MSKVMLIMLSDGLQLPSGMIAESGYRCLIYCRIPDDWIEGNVPPSSEMWIKGPTLKEDRLSELYCEMYGSDWQNGNGDGSKYVVLSVGMRLLNAAMEADRPWNMDDPNDKRFRYFYYVVDTQGKPEFVSVAQL